MSASGSDGGIRLRLDLRVRTEDPNGTYTYRPTGPSDLTTPLGDDVLLLTEFHGRERSRQLFQFELERLADVRTTMPFERCWARRSRSKIVRPSRSRPLLQRDRAPHSAGQPRPEFTHVPAGGGPAVLAADPQRAQSRIFQQHERPRHPEEGAEGLDVTYEIQGDFKPREYCVQYRESDFNFACRLMEEEGIYYFFKHTAGGHTMVRGQHAASRIPTFRTARKCDLRGDCRRTTSEEDADHDWEKAQEIRVRQVRRLWDHTFRVARTSIWRRKSPSWTRCRWAKSTHKLKAGNDKFGDLRLSRRLRAALRRHRQAAAASSPTDLQKIFKDNSRTAGIRMQQEAAGALLIDGAERARRIHARATRSSCRSISRQRQVRDHRAWSTRRGSHRRSRPATASSSYRTSSPASRIALPFRPQRTTPIPSVRGVQTATVVGPPARRSSPTSTAA